MRSGPACAIVLTEEGDAAIPSLFPRGAGATAPLNYSGSSLRLVLDSCYHACRYDGGLDAARPFYRRPRYRGAFGYVGARQAAYSPYLESVRRAAALALYPLWLAGLLASLLAAALRWARAAAGDGWDKVNDWRWAPLAGLLLWLGIGAVIWVCLTV